MLEVSNAAHFAAHEPRVAGPAECRQRNDDVAVPADAVIAFDRRIGLEDKTMLERIPGVLSLDVAATASVPADRPSLAWRRQFAALLQGAA